MSLVWSGSANKGTVLLLELAIADFAHDDGGGAYPSIRTLARKVRMSERNTQYIIQSLVSSKEMEIKRGAGPRGCNVYQINVALLKRRGAKFAPVQTSVRGVQSTAGGVQSSVNHRVQWVAPKPNHYKNRYKNHGAHAPFNQTELFQKFANR